MSTASWALREADPEEHRHFRDLATTLAIPSVLAAPPNRWREVRRLEVGGRTYYLKVFRRLQRKNAWRLSRTRPRARHEAEREAGMVGALRDAGSAAPRVVAVGCDGPASYFLCAELDGTPLQAHLGTPQGRSLLLAAAHEVGRLGRILSLPDASAEHVFVLGAAGARPRFAHLDLHNAHVGRADRRTLRRQLRHGAESLREGPVRRPLALRAALTLLRAHEVPRRQRRRLVQRLPPFVTHQRYDAPGKSDAYRQRSPRRTQRELALLATVWPGEPGDVVVDAPCGAGRLFPFLLARGHRVLGADRSAAMLRSAAASGDASLVCADAARLPLADKSAAGVVVFRFLHHLDAAAARRVVEAAARVADRWIVVSVFHPWSAHGAWRTLHGALTGRGRTRFALAPRRVTAWLRALGFERERLVREGVARDLCVLSFRRCD
ncbi:MAG: methyltransferase domain-containing protein [Planctomycetota bacterium]